MTLEALRHWNGAKSVRGNRVKAQVPRTTHYVMLGIALILAAATLSIVSPSRAYAASTAAVTSQRPPRAK